jgi:hypothetical protein
MTKKRRIRPALFALAALVSLPQGAGAEAYSESVNVVDRLKDGPHMLTESLEFIAAASFTTLHIAYNVYLHPGLATDASLSDLNPERILAEERMVSESGKTCANHLRANECYIFLWSDLAGIPPGDKAFVPSGMAGANGVYRAVKGGAQNFQWRNGVGRTAGVSVDAAYEPYQRDVRASNRFLSGARMMGEDMEFISAESMIRMTVLYHLYVHPKLLRDMNLRDLSSAQILAEKQMIEESGKVCAKHAKADKCVVLFWDDLASIPLESKQDGYEAFMAKAAGVYTKLKGKEPEFKWR